ncbi:MAG: sensor-containing diguanylate cyclase/phosphodiesterase, partial [Steroidobacteraceae bacterium]|nr:sensor-containing diguanylate cyclase/phosphodiesterase [Steroidobacteraceae bacterium]
MIGRGLKLRYVLAVVATGVVLTAVVATSSALATRHQATHLRAVMDELAAVDDRASDARVAELRARVDHLVESSDGRHVGLVVAIGLLLTALAGGVAAALLTRIDRALHELMNNAQLIGRGRYLDPVPVSGVAEVASLESSLEQMRQALASTTISRDYLDDVLNGMSDAVLVTSPDGRIRTANDAASRLFGVEGLPGTMFADLVAPEHRPTFDFAKLASEPGETVIRTGRGQTIPVSVNISPLGHGDAASSRGSIVVLRDITDRKRAERRIRYLARFDTLTKMP